MCSLNNVNIYLDDELIKTCCVSSGNTIDQVRKFVDECVGKDNWSKFEIIYQE